MFQSQVRPLSGLPRCDATVSAGWWLHSGREAVTSGICGVLQSNKVTEIGILREPAGMKSGTSSATFTVDGPIRPACDPCAVGRNQLIAANAGTFADRRPRIESIRSRE